MLCSLVSIFTSYRHVHVYMYESASALMFVCMSICRDLKNLHPQP